MHCSLQEADWMRYIMHDGPCRWLCSRHVRLMCTYGCMSCTTCIACCAALVVSTVLCNKHMMSTPPAGLGMRGAALVCSPEDRYRCSLLGDQETGVAQYAMHGYWLGCSTVGWAALQVRDGLTLAAWCSLELGVQLTAGRRMMRAVVWSSLRT